MKIISFYFFLLVVYFNLFGQIQNPNFDSLIKYKLFDPQKAIKFGFDGISSIENNENKILEFHLYYQLGEIFSNLNLYSESIEFLTKGTEILDKIPAQELNKNEQVQYGWIDINIGNIFFKTKNLDKAQNHYLNAKILFENNNKLTLEQKIYGVNTAENNLALIEIEKGNFELAKKYYLEILSRRKLVDKKSDLVYSYLSLMSLNIQISDLNEALFYFKEAQNLYYNQIENFDLDNELSLNYTYILENLGSYYFKIGDYDSALIYFLESDKILNEIGSKNLNLFFLIINSYLKLNDLKKSEEYIKRCELFYYELDVDNKIFFNELLVRKYDLEKQFIKSNEIKDSIISLYNQKNIQIQKSISLNLDTKLLVSKNQKEYLLKENSLKRSIYLSIIIILSLVLTTSIFYFRYKYSRIKNSKLVLEKENIKIELDSKKRELLSKTNFIVQRNEHLKQINQKIKNNNPKEIYQIEREINFLVNSEKHYQEFDKMFKEIYPDFSIKLKKDYGLSLTYIRLASYLKMNQSNKQIARICGISLRTVESQRYRLSKLFNLENGQELDKFINSI